MKIMQAGLFVAIGLAGHGASAQERPPALVMQSEMALATHPCELNVSSMELERQRYGVTSSATIDKHNKCLAAARIRMKTAYEAYLGTSPSEDAARSAKALYAANLVWADAIATASNRRELDQSIERAELRKAQALFKIDAGL